MGAFCPVAVSAQNLEIIVGGMTVLTPRDMIAVIFFISDGLATSHILPALLPVFPPLILFRKSIGIQIPPTPA